MLNEFARIGKVSDESLGRDETLRHTSHEILILHKYLTRNEERRKKERKKDRKKEKKEKPHQLK